MYIFFQQSILHNSAQSLFRLIDEKRRNPVYKDGTATAGISVSLLESCYTFMINEKNAMRQHCNFFLMTPRKDTSNEWDKYLTNQINRTFSKKKYQNVRAEFPHIQMQRKHLLLLLFFISRSIRGQSGKEKESPRMRGEEIFHSS